MAALKVTRTVRPSTSGNLMVVRPSCRSLYWSTTFLPSTVTVAQPAQSVLFWAPNPSAWSIVTDETGAATR